jgi:hypothetical protein
MSLSVLDVDAIERSVATSTIPEIVEYLQGHLGAKTVAYLAGLKDTQMLRKWRDGTEPQAISKRRLRTAYHAARLVIDGFDDDTADAWFFGSNARLDDDAPARVLRTATTVDDLRLIVPAAKAFARTPE